MAENNQNNPNNKKRTGLGAMFIILLFIAIIGIIVGVTINGRSRVDKSFSDVDLVLVKGSSTAKPKPSVDETNSSGAMYELFYKNAENSKPTLTIAHSVYTDDIYYISGNYTEGTKTRSYSGTLSKGKAEDLKYLIDAYNVNYGSLSENSFKYVTGKNFAEGEQKVNDYSWIWSLLTLVVLVVCIVFFIRSIGRSGQGGVMNFNQSRAKQSTGSKVRFTDVAGCDEVKNELKEVVEYFHNSDKYKKMGAKLPKGVLLIGPPGTGKTLLAKAVAGEASVPFYSISGSDFVEMYVGVGAGRVRDMFNTAKKNAPCLIFIDEIDAVGRQRGAGLGGGNDEREQTLNQLLVEMDGFEDNSGIIVMAATNREDVLDPALLRPGRFDRTITVDLPDKAGREAILKVHSRNKPLAKDINFASIAAVTVGFSGADLANVMNEAAILAVRNGESVISSPDITEAIDRRIAGPAKKTHMEANEKRQVAFHEAGHAIIGLTLPDADRVQSVSIIPRGRTGGHTLMTPEHDHFLYTKNQLIARITGYLGGRCSEEIFFGDVSTGASDDFQKATRIARSMVTEYGMSPLGPVQYEDPNQDVFLGRDYNNTQKNFSGQVAYEIDQAERKIIEECYAKAKEIITSRIDDVTLIADALIEKETINDYEIQYLLTNRKLPTYETQKVEAPKGEDDYTPLNPNNITLIDDYKKWYKEVDKINQHGLHNIVLVVASTSAAPIDKDQFKEIVVSRFPDGKIGAIFITKDDVDKLSASPRVLGEHLEKYSSDKVLYIDTDEMSVETLRDMVKGL